MTAVVLHGYWRSSAAYRVRIALALKDVAFEQVTHDLRHGEQRDPEYLRLAPHALVPTLEVDGTVIIESPAILEWIEARWPTPSLIPNDIDDAAVVRAMSALVACDVHPLNNLRVLNELRRQFGANEAQIKAWVARWIATGFDALETLVARHGGVYVFGDAVTLADCYVVPQIYNARRFEIDLTHFPRLQAAVHATSLLPAFVAAHPDNQPDADR